MSDKLADEGAEIDKVLNNIWWQNVFQMKWWFSMSFYTTMQLFNLI